MENRFSSSNGISGWLQINIVKSGDCRQIIRWWLWPICVAVPKSLSKPDWENPLGCSEELTFIFYNVEASKNRTFVV